MTGKDLFAALNHVDDTLVAEAETYTARRVIPLPTVRWLGALAACFCLLIGWAVLARTGLMDMSKGGMETAMLDKGITEGYTTTTEATAEEAAVEESAEVAVEEAETEEAETGDIADRAAGAAPAETPAEDETAYLIFAEALPEVKSEGKASYTDVQNGTVILDAEIEGTLGQLAIANLAKPARFLVTFDLYKDGMLLDPDSAEYLSEIERLTALGYEFRTLNVQHRDKSVWVRVCGLLTQAQLAQFEASEDYGYLLYFPENEDGTPLNWADEVALCGLPAAEEAE